MKAIIRFYKVSFLTGAHAATFAWWFSAINLFSEGKLGPAIAFGALASITTMALAVWWLNGPAG